MFAVSTDGGATFTQTVLRVDDDRSAICADVISPAPNTVVVVDPTDDCDKDACVWSDTNRGAGFANGTVVSLNEYEADGRTGGLDIDRRHRAAAIRRSIDVEQNGTTEIGGEATESPRLFTDGAGRVCITYIADYDGRRPATPEHAYVQCSDDLGVTFTPRTRSIRERRRRSTTATRSARSARTTPRRSRGCVRPTRIEPGAYVFLATSSDDGTRGAPRSQVPTYVLPGTTSRRPAMNPTLAYDATGILWIAYRVDDGGTTIGSSSTRAATAA